jgi:hypothetical protein
MPDLVVQDDVQDLHRALVAGLAQLGLDGGVASRPRASSVRGTRAMRASTSSRVRSAICHRPSWASKSP